MSWLRWGFLPNFYKVCAPPFVWAHLICASAALSLDGQSIKFPSINLLLITLWLLERYAPTMVPKTAA